MEKGCYRIAAVVFAASVLFGLPSFALSGGKTLAKRFAAEDYFGQKLVLLGLSTRQKEQIRVIFTEHQDALAGKMTAYFEKRRILRALINNADADEKEVYGLAREKGELEGDLAVERMKIMKQILAILTPEQAAKFKNAPSSPGASMAEPKR